MLQWTLGYTCLFRFWFPSMCMSNTGIAQVCESSISRFLRNLHTVLHSGLLVCISSSLRGFTFLHTISSISSLQTFWWQPFWLAEVVLIVSLICISLIMSNVEHFFLCLLAMCMSSLKKCVFSSLAHFFWWDHLFFSYWAACMFWRLILHQLFCKLLCSPILKAAYHLAYSFLHCAKMFKFNQFNPKIV